MNKFLAFSFILTIKIFAISIPITQYHSLQATFVKSSWLNSNLLDKEKGEIFIKKPNMFKYQTPNTTLITDNNQVVFIDKKTRAGNYS